jgi:hypothetical protein
LTTALHAPGIPDTHDVTASIEEQGSWRARQLSDDMLPDAHGHPTYESMYHEDALVPSAELLNDIGISSTEFLAIIDQIGNPDTGYSLLDLG